jgi:hypothetical protein
MKRIRFRRHPSPESQHNNSSATVGILDKHACAHRIGKRPNQGQTNATTWDPGAVRTPPETLEHDLSFIRWNSRSMVTNPQEQLLRIQAAADLHR